MTHPTRRRCAIYTRKSSEEGLDQAFNSLDAQREACEACEAYIASQRHEGWQALPTAYDDGGLSGGTLERPAMQRLLADIRAGRVDLVVVYKVDRLTRSLNDFAKIVEVFDAHGASFVSVTQQFNTTTSMGRLTLNMLLSFAQFEREVTGERIRDKIAASKRKGMWMGGVVPLGYDVRDRRLEINEAEAATVRHIFARYLALGSVDNLAQELAADGIYSKARPWMADARMQGGKVLARGALYTLLQNRLYRGEVAHRGQVHPGQHIAIIDEALWDAVQARLSANRVERVIRQDAAALSLLAGLLYDADGQRLVPTHANNAGKRYRYYVSQALLKGKRGRPSPARVAQRIPAGEIEALVIDRIKRWLGTPRNVLTAMATDARTSQQALVQAKQLTERWKELSPASIRAVLWRLLARVEVHPTRVDLHLAASQLSGLLADAAQGNLAASASRDPMITGRPRIGRPPKNANNNAAMAPGHHHTNESASPSATVVISVPAQLRRAGLEMALIVDGAEQATRVDPNLMRVIANAHAMANRMVQPNAATLDEFAASKGISTSWATRMMRLVYLSPRIVTAILEGRQPVGLTANKLMQDTRLPMDWREQERRLGFG